VWAGVGTLLIAVIGIVFFAESTSLLKMVSMLFVIVGVVGLNLANSIARG